MGGVRTGRKQGRDVGLRVSLDAFCLAEIGLVDTVDLGKLDVLVLEGGGRLLAVRSEGPAVAAPGRKELDEDERFRGNGGLKVGGVEADNVRGSL